MELFPLRGLNEFKFGDSKAVAESLFGIPDEVRGKDSVSSEVWFYSNLGIEFHFDSDEGLLLWGISIYSENHTLNGMTLIGLTEKQLISEFPNLELEVCYGQFKEYVDKANELVVFLRFNVVTRLDMSPNLDQYIGSLSNDT